MRVYRCYSPSRKEHCNDRDGDAFGEDPDTFVEMVDERNTLPEPEPHDWQLQSADVQWKEAHNGQRRTDVSHSQQSGESMNLPAIDPSPRSRVRLWDEDWNVLADTTVDGPTAVHEWLRHNATAGTWASVDSYGHRTIGRVEPDGRLKDPSEDVQAVQWPGNPFLERPSVSG